MRRATTTEEFIEKAYNIHKDKYDYNLVEYKNNSTKVIIVCHLHGQFYQIPAIHLNGSGCPDCGKIKNHLNTTSNTEKFIEKSKSIYGNKYDYSLVEYKKNSIEIKIICPIHGEFVKTPASHLRGHGCAKCSTRLTNEKFIDNCKLKHGDFYDYSLVKYEISRKKVKIICPIHGMFEQVAMSHARGKGCLKCKIGIYSEIYFYNNPKKKLQIAKLYWLKFTNKESNEIFYKIGITSTTIKLRISHICDLYNIEILKIKEMNLYNAFLIEQRFMRYYSKYQYIPLHKFDGYTECFREI